LGDLLAGRRSTRGRIDRCLTRPTLRDAIPGDLSFVFPYRHLLTEYVNENETHDPRN